MFVLVLGFGLLAVVVLEPEPGTGAPAGVCCPELLADIGGTEVAGTEAVCVDDDEPCVFPIPLAALFKLAFV